MPSLPIHQMASRHSGLTPATADSNAEAAAVCLDRHHEPPQDMKLDRDGAASIVAVDWVAPNARVKQAWANEIDATEAGACACALAAIELSDGLFAVGRAEVLTGADYYIAPAGKGIHDLEECRRFEVSGTDRGDANMIRRRLAAKRNQAAKGQSSLPATAAVVGFQAAQIMLADVIDDEQAPVRQAP